MGELSLCVPGIGIWQSEESKKCCFSSFRSIFKLVFLSQYKFFFLHQELNRKHNICTGKLKWKIVGFWCIRILMVPIFPKNLIIILLDIQAHAHFSPITTGFISFIKVWIKNFLVVETFSMEMLLILFLASENWPSDSSNNALCFVSSPYSNF